MMGKIKSIITNWRVILVAALIIASLIAIQPKPFNSGVAIRSVIKGSPAYLSGFEAKPGAPMSKEVILSINNEPVKDTEAFYNFESRLEPNRTIQIKTTKGIFRLTTAINDSKELGLRVYDAPKTNIRQGLDLQGGTRVLLRPEKRLSQEDMGFLLANMKQRLNVYGLGDVVVRDATDLSGNQYIMVEIAGVNEEEIRGLLARQGKFEAKVGNNTVFTGGNDITYVCRTAECSGLDPNVGCGSSGSEIFCRFRFSISLTPQAAERQAFYTNELSVVREQQNKEQYLNETLDLYLDDQKVDELRIAADLKGKAVTEIQITGSGSGSNQDLAIVDSMANMRRLQTLLITGSLPVKLEIVKTDSVSPVLGEQFVKNSALVGLLAVLGVAFILLIFYRNLKIALAILLTMLVEVFLIMGAAASIGWNIDLAAIAGIIVIIGTGVDDQIVISDEVMMGERRKAYSWKDKMSNAFFIIIGAYLVFMVAMIPLLFAGAGLLRGFALTTMIGLTIGVLITRPAYAKVIEILIKE